MTRHLIHLSCPSWVLDNMIMYDTIVRLYQQGDEIHVFYADDTIPVSFSNPNGKKLIENWVQWYRSTMDKQLPREVKIHTFKEFYTTGLKEKIGKIIFLYNSVEEIKKLKYKNVQIGYGALSTYISQTRNINPLIDNNFKIFFNKYLKAECLLVELLDAALKKIKPDIVSLYNGRFFENRPVYEYSKSLGYQVRCYENIRPFGIKNGMSSVFYENSLPHNIRKKTTIIENNWSRSILSDSKKKKIAHSFFNNRRKGLVAGDKVYTAKQNSDFLPKNWDAKKRNIVIFNSSEDEFVAIGDEYSGLSLFSNQIEGIKNILELFKKDNNFHFYLRIHPNLKKIKYRYHLDLYKLEEEYKNITVISPGSKINSYVLLDNAEKIIVFGSTIGVEAAYWGKPVILLSEAFYSYFNLCYTPSNIVELKELITENLKNRNRLPAIKYGFFIMKDSRGKLITNFDTKCIVIKKKYFFFRYKPIRYSTLYLAIIKIFFIVLNKVYPQSKNKIPIKENKQ